MSRPWAVAVPADRAAAVARLRLIDGISILPAATTLWLRGERLDDELERRLRALPDARRFERLPDGQLVPAGSLVPTDRLPEGVWRRLTDWAAAALPQAEFAGVATARVRLAASSSSDPREPGVLVTTQAIWRAYGVAAPQVRLERWTFAACRDGRVVVRGAPLPPVPGALFVEEGGVAVAAGWRCDPPVDSETLRAILGIVTGDVGLLHADGTWERIAGRHFVKATRSAIRATCPPSAP